MTEHRFHPSKADKLISKDRQERLPVERILKAMNLERGDVVADLGSGNGYFTLPIAKKTGEIVYAVDVEPQMHELLKGRADEQDIENINYITHELRDIPLKDSVCDFVLISLVLHEVPDLAGTLKEAKRLLKSKGTLFIIEWEGVESDDGPPLHIRIASKDMAEKLEEIGFKTEIFPLNEAEYALKAQ